MTKEQMESDVERLKEGFGFLKGEVELLKLLVTKQSDTQTEAQRVETKKYIQINANGKTYLCPTPRGQQIFSENNPGVETESFNIELTAEQADRYLNNPENKKQFIKKET